MDNAVVGGGTLSRTPSWFLEEVTSRWPEPVRIEATQYVRSRVVGDA
jgi:hypothetical protein